MTKVPQKDTLFRDGVQKEKSIEDLKRAVVGSQSNIAVTQEAPLNINYTDVGGFEAAIERTNASPADRDLGIYVPPGVWPGATIESTKDKVNIFGEGSGSILEFDDNNPDGFIVSGRYSQISNIAVEATDPTNTEGYAINIQGADCKARNVKHAGFGGAVKQSVGAARFTAETVTGILSDFTEVNWWDIEIASGSKYNNCHTTGGQPHSDKILTVDGASGGNITLKFYETPAQETTTIAHNANAGTVQSALEALSNIAVGDVVVTGGPLNTAPMTIHFQGNLTPEQSHGLRSLTVHTSTLTGGGTAVITNGSIEQAYVHIAFTDSLFFTNFICFQNPGQSGTTGIRYAVYIDSEQESVNNTRFRGCGFDGSDTAGVVFRGDSTLDTSRVIGFDKTRFETCSGVLLDFDHAGAGTEVQRAFGFNDCEIIYGVDQACTSSVVRATGEKVKGMYFTNNRFLSTASQTIDSIMQMGVAQWVGVGNQFISNNSSPQPINYIWETIADCEAFTTGGNSVDSTQVGYFKHYAYSTNRQWAFQVNDGPGSQPIFKQGNQTLTQSSTSFQNVTDLSFQAPPNTRFWFRLLADLVGPSSIPDIKWQWNLPSGAAVKWLRADNMTGVNTGGSPTALSTGTLQGGLGALENTQIYEGWISISSTGGTAQLQAAQNTSDPSDVIIKQGTMLEYKQSLYG